MQSFMGEWDDASLSLTFKNMSACILELLGISRSAGVCIPYAGSKEESNNT